MSAQMRNRSTLAPNYKGLSVDKWDMGLIGDDMLRALETEHEQAQRRIKARFNQSILAKQGFNKPRFGTNAYREYVRKGYITPEEAEADAIMREIRAERAGRGAKNGTQGAGRGLLSSVAAPRAFEMSKRVPVRWGRQSPIPSDQYAPNMATTAARDERLTPNAKALLQIIHARCGKEGITETTKGTLANIMNRSTRTIQRYIADLVQFGYLFAHTKRNARGLYVGLVMRVSELTKPFYEDLKRTSDLVRQFFSLGASETDLRVDYSDKTQVSSKKQISHRYNSDSLIADPFD
ncbi:MAG: hypothetical protein ACJAZW_001669 [Maritalea sp.]|jgi:hypothetical protein